MSKTNKDVAGFLEHIGTLMRLAGENNFRAIAFDKAARTIESLEQSVEQLVADGELTTIKGIGKSIASDIEQYLTTGSADVVDSLYEKVPEGLIEWLQISGLGPKKIHKIHKEFGITSIAELKEYCENGKVASLSGMGKKSAEKILKSIEWMEQFSDRCRLDEAKEIADRFLSFLSSFDEVKKIEVAGSLRRSRETIGDIDILIATEEENATKIFDAFTTHESVIEVLGKGDTKSSIRVKEGRQVDLRIVSEKQFDAALMYFTGSKEHNVVMRQRARDKNLALNEYGLFHLDDDGNTNFEKIVDVYSEQKIYNELGLNWIPPELREDRGEFKLFENDLDSPEFVQLDEIKGILHAHSTYSDGAFSIKQMADACIEKGYSYLGLTDHSKTAAYAGGLTEKRVFEQWKEIDALNNEFEKNGISFRILKGIESDILGNGDLDYEADVLKDFDFIIASVHFSLDMAPDKMLDRFKRAVENPYTRIIGHPTGRLLLKRDGNPFDMNALIEYAAEHNTAIEINANPWRLDLDWTHGNKAQSSGLYTAICPDAHHVDGIDDVQYGVAIARKAKFKSEKVLNTKTVDELMDWFKSPL